MKQSNFFSDYEIEVSEILLNLKNLISQTELGSRFSFTWGTSKRRSAFDSIPPPPPPPPSPPPPGKTRPEQTERRPPKVKAEAATSPATPLSFSPSESDEKLKHRRSSSKKRTRDDLMEKLDELSRTREQLRKELENVKCYHSNQKAINLALKAKKQELSKKGSSSSSIAEQGVVPLIVHQQPLIFDQTVENYQYLVSSSGSGLGVVNHLGPLGIPDLNVSAEEAFGLDAFQPLDCATSDNSRAKAAEARKKRMVRIKEMKTLNVIKPPPRFR